MQPHLKNLSPDHPLHANPARPWPYAVLIGYRARGKRSVVAMHTLYVRATSLENARATAMREALSGAAWIVDGIRLKASRPLSARPLDKGDCIGHEVTDDE